MNILFITHTLGHDHLKQTLVAQNPDMALMSADSLHDAQALLQRHQYDCTILADSGKDDAFEQIRLLKQLAPQTPILVLDPPHVRTGTRRAILRESGAHDFVESDDATQLLPKLTRYISENARMRRELDKAKSDLKARDTLTGVLNRRGIAQQLAGRIEKAPMSVIMMDCDRLKALNQKFGYGVGDLALCQIARTTQAQLPAQSIFGRVGGDRFMAILPQTSILEAMAIAEQIRRAIRTHPIELSDGSNTAMTVSLGLLEARPEIDTVSELIALAQIPLLEAKHKGLNALVCADPMQQPTHAKRELSLLEDIISSDNLTIACQPIVNLKTNTIHSFELLCRGPAGLLASPYALFSAALAHNLLYALDINCIRAALQVYKILPPNTKVSVNILPSTLINTPTEQILRLFDEHNIDPSCICLELNEQQLTEDPRLLQGILAPLKAHGIRLAIDDVGFGKTCLEHLLYLSPDFIKIDKCILHNTKDALNLLTKLVNISHVIGAQVVVEGVETVDMKHMVLKSKAHLAQGFLWGKPEPFDVKKMPFILTNSSQSN